MTPRDRNASFYLRAAYVRPIVALAALVLEYLVVSLRFDARVLHQRGGDLAFLGYLGDVGAVLLVVAAAMLALAGPQLRAAIVAREDDLPSVPWAAWTAHLASYAAFFASCAHVLDPARESVSTLAVTGWIGAASALGVTWLPIALPWSVLKTSGRPLLTSLALSAAVGVATWLWGQASMRIWPLVAPTTLGIVVELLSWMAPQVVSEPSAAIIGTPEFQVVVSPLCSGLEGVGLIVALLSSYIALERKQLQVARALALIPIAVLASFASNALRIALLVMVGTHISPDIALGGFHSKAGWLFFCALSLAFIAVLRSVSFFRAEDARVGRAHEPILQSAAAPYLVPMLAVIATSLLTGLFTDGIDRLYALRVIAGAAALLAYRGRYDRRADQPWFGLCIGCVVFGVWLSLAQGGDGAALRDDLEHMSRAESLTWLLARALGTVLLIPCVEELAFRGYVLRQLATRNAQSPGASAFAWIASSVGFGLLHSDWIAGTIAGLLFAFAQQRRGRTSDAIIAHATANALLLGDAWLRGNLGWLA